MLNDTTAQERIRFLRGLRAVRQFRSEPVPKEVVDGILEVARWSGSASNQQPWEIIVIRDRDTLQALSKVEGYAKHLANAMVGIVVVLKGEAGRVTQEAYDEGRLSERIMLAASAYGVGSCIGWFVNNGQTAAKDILGIPQERFVRTSISLGYPDEEARRARPKPEQVRKPIAAIVHQERYS